MPLNLTKIAFGAQSFADANSIRRMALTYKIPYYTLLTAARAGIKAIRAMRAREIDVAPLQDYFDRDEEQIKEAV